MLRERSSISPRSRIKIDKTPAKQIKITGHTKNQKERNTSANQSGSSPNRFGTQKFILILNGFFQVLLNSFFYCFLTIGIDRNHWFTPLFFGMYVL